MRRANVFAVMLAAGTLKPRDRAPAFAVGRGDERKVYGEYDPTLNTNVDIHPANLVEWSARRRRARQTHPGKRGRA